MDIVVKGVRHSGPIFGAALIGAAVGMVLVSVQFPIESCGIAATESCAAILWAETWSTRSVVAGGLLIAGGIGSEWWLDREDDN